jgi:hypothetical protein
LTHKTQSVLTLDYKGECLELMAAVSEIADYFVPNFGAANSSESTPATAKLVGNNARTTTRQWFLFSNSQGTV